jgi:hypothetical protein
MKMQYEKVLGWRDMNEKDNAEAEPLVSDTSKLE